MAGLSDTLGSFGARLRGCIESDGMGTLTWTSSNPSGP
jgi:hypothetical protein